jgi:DNA polymerase III delta subunit
MLSRARYLKALERDLNASRKIIDDLTQENYELREVLKTIQNEKRSSSLRSPTR